MIKSRHKSYISDDVLNMRGGGGLLKPCWLPLQRLKDHDRVRLNTLGSTLPGTVTNCS